MLRGMNICPNLCRSNSRKLFKATRTPQLFHLLQRLPAGFQRDGSLSIRIVDFPIMKSFFGLNNSGMFDRRNSKASRGDYHRYWKNLFNDAGAASFAVGSRESECACC